MATNQVQSNGDRPVIFDYRAIHHYVKDMIAWRKSSDGAFSIRKETRGLYRCSPALVSEVTRGRRRLTLDRVDAFSKLLLLQPEERTYLGEWVGLHPGRNSSLPPASTIPTPRKRRTTKNHLLSHWLNVYVKDSVRLKDFAPDATVIFRLLGGLASIRQIERSLSFLFREGFLRKTLEGKTVEDSPLVMTTDEQLDKKIQAFHKHALQLARRGIGLYPLEQRRESVVVLPVNRAHLPELKRLLKDFYEKVLVFAETHTQDDEQLYQVILNLSPIGGNAS